MTALRRQTMPPAEAQRRKGCRYVSSAVARLERDHLTAETHSSTLPSTQSSILIGYTFANKLTNITAGSAVASHRYAYDHAGNLTNLMSSTATNRYLYNAQNKLVRIEGRGFTNEFAYDSQNRRIGVNLGAVWRYDVHDGNLCIASVVNGLLDRFFVRGAGIAEGTGDVIAEIPDPRNPSPHPYYYISNHRGDTLVVLSYTYTIAARYEYDAFGNVIEQTGYTPRYTFSTKEYLPAAKLYLYQYRVYDPIAGRWTQRDPIDYQDSINLYQFCGNNPVNCQDADGRWGNVVIGAAVGLVAGGLAGGLMGKSWKAAARGALTGLVGGAVAGATFNPALGLATAAGLGSTSAGIVAGVASGAAAGMAGGTASETFDYALHDKELNLENLTQSAKAVAVSTGVGAVMGGLIGGVAGNCADIRILDPKGMDMKVLNGIVDFNTTYHSTAAPYLEKSVNHELR